MNANDVRCTALPAVVANDGTRGIQCLREMVERLNRVPVLTDGWQFGHAPGLIERYPHDDAGVAVVPLDRFRPLLNCALDRRAGEAIRRWHFLPNYQTKPVRPVHIARVLYLLVLSYAVEAHGLRQSNIVPQSVVVGR